MKPVISILLILSVLAGTAVSIHSPVSREPMTDVQMSSALGTGFWGGFACGVAAGATVAGLGFAATVTTAGVGTIWAIAIGTSLAGHVFGACLLL